MNVENAISVRVVEAVARSAGVDETALPPLYDALDADALDALVADAPDGLTRVAFTYAGHRVVVDGDGRVDVESL